MNSQKSQVRWFALLGATAVTLYGCWLLMRPFLGVLTWAVVLVVTFYPVHRRLAAWTRRPWLAAMISSALAVVAVLAPVTIAGLAVGREVPDMVRGGQDALQKLLDPNSPTTGGTVRWLNQYVDIESLRSSQTVTNGLGDLSKYLAGAAFGWAAGLLGVVVQAFFVIFTIYYLFRDGEALVEWLPRVLPLEEAQGKELLRRAQEMIAASVYGVIVLAVIQGILGGLAFLVLGLPNPVVWCVVMVILSAIPVTGSFLVWAPAAVYLATTGRWGAALLLAAWGVMVIGLVDNFMRPKVMGQKARMHELLLFFAILGGLVVFGAPGLIFGPVLVAVTLCLLDVIRQTGQPAEAIRHKPGLAEQTARIADEAPAAAGMP
ncbi:AI-2E family transporter [soil metagenome]